MGGTVGTPRASPGAGADLIMGGTPIADLNLGLLGGIPPMPSRGVKPGLIMTLIAYFIRPWMLRVRAMGAVPRGSCR